MIAQFDNVKQFAIFNAQPHLVTYSTPYQLGVSDKDLPVYVELHTGSKHDFVERVEQFGGIIVDKWNTVA